MYVSELVYCWLIFVAQAFKTLTAQFEESTHKFKEELTSVKKDKTELKSSVAQLGNYLSSFSLCVCCVLDQSKSWHLAGLTVRQYVSNWTRLLVRLMTLLHCNVTLQYSGTVDQLRESECSLRAEVDSYQETVKVVLTGNGDCCGDWCSVTGALSTVCLGQRVSN